MFGGEYIHTIDDKFRVVVPQAFRSLLGKKFIITRGIGGCIWVLSKAVFGEIEARMGNQPFMNDSATLLKRFFFSGAIEVTPDAQGRIALPQSLRDYAGINKEVAIIGTGDHVEIWGKAKWDEFNKSISIDDIGRAAREVGMA